MSRLVAPSIRGTALGEAVAEPEKLLARADARWVKDHRRTAVAAVTVAGRDVYVKHFKPYALYRRFEAAFASSLARRCWRSAERLRAAGFGVPPALAAVDRTAAGLPADSYFVSAAVDRAEPAGRWWTGRGVGEDPRGRRVALDTAARELRRLHDAGFYTKDANADNFLLRQDVAGFEFFLLDLENVRRPGRVSERRRRKNLVQLLRPIRAAVRRIERVRFVAVYLGHERSSLRAWLAALARLDAAKEAEYRARPKGPAR